MKTPPNISTQILEHMRLNNARGDTLVGQNKLIGSLIAGKGPGSSTNDPVGVVIQAVTALDKMIRNGDLQVVRLSSLPTKKRPAPESVSKELTYYALPDVYIETEYHAKKIPAVGKPAKMKKATSVKPLITTEGKRLPEENPA
jgi:hypothetical protein